MPACLRIAMTAVLAVGLCVSCAEHERDTVIRNVSAFADVYGLVRWFHPSDEAAEVDWNSFALYGVSKVKDCRDIDVLKRELESMFLPVAPGISFTTDETYDGLGSITPADTCGMDVVSWQHYGVDLGLVGTPYISKRTCRSVFGNEREKFVMNKAFMTAGYVGSDIVIRIPLRIVSDTDDFKVFVRAALIASEDEMLRFMTSSEPPIVNTGEWTVYEKRFHISEECAGCKIVFGISTEGCGTLDYGIEDIRSDKFGKVRNVTSWGDSMCYDYTQTGNYRTAATKDLIFDRHSEFGDVYSREIAEGLYVHVPLALYATPQYTYPVGDAVAMDNLRRDMQSYEATQQDMVLADLTVIWNVVKYFSSYLAEQSIDWDSAFCKYLDKALRSHSFDPRLQKEFLYVLNDAHSNVYETSSSEWYYLPVRVIRMKEGIVVRESFSDVLLRGDIILDIDGRNALDSFESLYVLAAGRREVKDQLVERLWLRSFGADRNVKVTVSRAGETVSLSVPLIGRDDFIHSMSSLPRSGSRWIDDDILYLDLATTDYEDVLRFMGERTERQTVIFDIRDGCRFDLANVLFLLAGADRLSELPRKGILNVPQVIYPATPVIQDTLKDLPVPEPDSQNIFLIGPSNYSNHEYVIDCVRYMGLGLLVGADTGGCNGIINRIVLPSGESARFTGMKVLSNIGRSHYYFMKGIHPDIAVDYDLQDIAEGNDTVLATAIGIADSAI